MNGKDQKHALAGEPYRKSGRAVFEANGKTSWEWQTSTGVFQQHITEDQLRQISAPDLQVVEYSEPEPRSFEGRLWTRASR